MPSVASFSYCRVTSWRRHSCLPRRDSSRRLGIALFLISLSGFPLSPATFTFHITGDTPGPWPNILSSVGLTNSPGPTNLFILRGGAGTAMATATAQQWIDKIQKGPVVVVRG